MPDSNWDTNNPDGPVTRESAVQVLEMQVPEYDNPGLDFVKQPTHILISFLGMNSTTFQTISYDVGDAKFRTFEGDIRDAMDEPKTTDSAFGEFWTWVRDNFENFEEREDQERYEAGEALILTLRALTAQAAKIVDAYDNDDCDRAPGGVSSYVALRSTIIATDAVLSAHSTQ